MFYRLKYGDNGELENRKAKVESKPVLAEWEAIEEQVAPETLEISDPRMHK